MAQEPVNITGRDMFIICNALAYAIITIERRPVAFRETSDCNDMKKLLEHFGSTYGTAFYMENARRHIDGVAFNESNVVDLMRALKGVPNLQE